MDHPFAVCMHLLTPAIGDHRVMREAAALADAGYAVTIVDIDHREAPLRHERAGNVALEHVALPWRNTRDYEPHRTLPWLAFKIARIARGALRVLRTRADAYHAHDITALPACWLAAALRGKPLIFDAHELPMTQQHLLHRRLLTGASRALLRMLMRRCTRTITVSAPIADEMQRLYGGPPASLVRNVAEYHAPMNDDRLRKHFRLPKTTRIALYQGHFQGNRSLDVLVRTAVHLEPNIAIVLLGSGPDRPQIEALIQELGVADRILIKGWVNHDELLSWTASADLGLCIFSRDISMSTRFCLPNKLFEYLMAGLPVLTTQLDAVVDLVRHYNVGKEIDTMDPPMVAHAINAMLDDRVELERMHRNAVAACRDELRWDVESQSLVRLYDGLDRPPHRTSAGAMQAPS